MKVAVRYKRKNGNHQVYESHTLIIEVEKGVPVPSNTLADLCHDYISEMLGEDPKWIRIEGEAVVTPF